MTLKDFFIDCTIKEITPTEEEYMEYYESLLVEGDNEDNDEVWE